MIKINLGCGRKKLKGFINCDKNKAIKPDMVLDLNIFPYPFSKNYADYIILDNVLEHLTDIVAVLKELYRILKPSGILEIYVPYAKSDGAFQDPTHKHYFTENSFDYFEKNSIYSYDSSFSYTIHTKKLECVNKTRLSKLRNIIPFKNTFRYVLFNMFDQVHFILKPNKNR